MVSDDTLKKLQEQIAAWPMTQRFVVQQLIRDYLRDREDLRAYKDTGLTPEEAKRMSNILMDVGIDYNCSWEYVKNCLPDTRLRELAEADKGGRAVVLPAKTVFELTWDAGPDCDLICPVSVDREGCCSFCDKGELCIYERKCLQEHIEQIGKTVFLNREEVEKALEAMEK